MVKTLEIFIASADEDRKSLDMLLKELEGTLQPLRQRGLISIWHKRDILPGAIIHQEIQKHLQAARIILLLISRDFINQDFCYSEEMKQLMQRHHAGEIHIIPILLRETSWEYTPFSTLRPLPDNGQPVNSWGNKDKAFSNIAKGVRKIVDKLLPPPSTPLTGSEANQPSGNGLSSTSSHRSTSKSPSSSTRRQRKKASAPAPDQVYDGVMNYYGVVVGVGKYEDTINYAPMPACVADAKAVAKQLTSNGYEHIRLLVDRDTDEDPLIQELTGDNTELSTPIRGNIISALKTVAEMTRPQDLLLFYYTGHGSMDGEESYLVAHNGRKNALEDTALSVSTMKKIMLQAPAQKKVIILDACRTEAAPGSKGIPLMSPAFIERVFDQATGLVILTSCSAGESSYVWKEKQRSVFTHYLLQALVGGKADFNGKDRLSARDIYNYVLSAVKRWAMLNNCSQTPYMTTDGQGDIVVAYYQQTPTASNTNTPEERIATIISPPTWTLSWKSIPAIKIQGEQYVFERRTVHEPPTGDDGAILREARVQHVGTDLPLWLKQIHVIDPGGAGTRLQHILKKERQILIDLESEGHHDFPRVFPLIDGDLEKDFMFAYILTNEQSLFQTFAGSKKLLDAAAITRLLQSILPLCDALGVLHKKNLSHRCLSLDTLALSKGRYAMVQSVGLAAWEPKKGENPDRYFPGRHILAPEQEKTNSDIVTKPGPATDIYQLGALLHFLITGQTISPGSLVSFNNRTLPLQLSAAIRSAVTRQPEQRCPSMEEFAAALRQAM